MPPALDSDDKDSARKLNIETVSSEGNDDSLVQIDGRKMSSKEPKPVVVGPGGDAENVANGTDPTVDQDDSKAEGEGHTRKRSGSPRKVVVTTHRHLSPSPGRDGRRQRTASCSQLQTSSKNTTIEPLIRTPNRTIYTAGRPPWYDSHGQQAEPCFIGICGGSASGKTTVAKAIIETLEVPWVTLLSMDSFYKILSPEQSALAHGSDYNFDSPDAFDFELLVETLHKLKEGKKVEVPIYNFVTHSREAKSKTMYGANVVIFEGIMSFHHEEVLKLLDVKVFVDTDSDVRLARRLERDIAQRGRDLRGVVTQYERFVKPAYDTYIAPSKAHADIVVPRGGENDVAIGLIVQHVQSQLHSRGFRVREKLLANEIHEEQPLPSQVYLLPSTRQIIGMHTYIRSKATPRDEFVFYSQRLMRLLMEYALTFLPHKEVIVDTATGQPYKGMTLDTHNICGVSIVRAGETMEQALTDVLKDVRIGKILIQTNLDNGEAELYYLRLPSNIHNYHVMVMDATVATGAAAMMAIRILLDHDVPEENILLLSLLMAKIGVQTIAYAFPKVRIITTAVDNKVNDQFYVVPGIGNFGDRYYGTEATPGF